MVRSALINICQLIALRQGSTLPCRLRCCCRPQPRHAAVPVHFAKANLTALRPVAPDRLQLGQSVGRSSSIVRCEV